MNLITVVQARTQSTRLPGKVLLPVLGRPLILHMLERLARAKKIGTLVLATSTNPSDDNLAKIVEQAGFNVFRGDENDLIDRHLKAAEHFSGGRPIDAVAKVPSDCPLIDPAIFDRVAEAFENSFGQFDYVSNLHPQSYPDGSDVEIVSFAALKNSHTEAQKPYEREHTTPFFWNHPERFRLLNVAWETGLDLSKSIRLTIDYREDFDLISQIIERLSPEKPNYSLTDILDLLKSDANLLKINADFIGVNWYRHHQGELKNI